MTVVEPLEQETRRVEKLLAALRALEAEMRAQRPVATPVHLTVQQAIDVVMSLWANRLVALLKAHSA